MDPRQTTLRKAADIDEALKEAVATQFLRDEIISLLRFIPISREIWTMLHLRKYPDWAEGGEVQQARAMLRIMDLAGITPADIHKRTVFHWEDIGKWHLLQKYPIPKTD